MSDRFFSWEGEGEKKKSAMLLLSKPSPMSILRGQRCRCPFCSGESFDPLVSFRTLAPVRSSSCRVSLRSEESLSLAAVAHPALAARNPLNDQRRAHRAQSGKAAKPPNSRAQSALAERARATDSNGRRLGPFTATFYTSRFVRASQGFG